MVIVIDIQFIYENAENLGGDKNRVTIFGESAGGISVGCHLLNSKIVSTNFSWKNDKKLKSTSLKILKVLLASRL